MSPHLAFNTAVSFVTNTNWQSYGGETTLSHFSQMVGLTVQNFVSAAVGISMALALTRAFLRSGAQTVGNFWVDLTRATLYVLLPLAVIVALAFVAMGLPQTLDASVSAATLEGAQQTIALGPIASQEAIKQLGTNGGGFLNANAAHPFENPTALANYLNIVAMLAVSAALVYACGQMVGDRRQGWAFLAVTGILLLVGTGIIYWAETSGNPILTALGVDPAVGNMEGKEVRFGQAMTAAYAAVTTGLSDGGVNATHGSFTGLGGLVPMFLIQLGEVLPGGVGSGLYGMLVFAILAVFVAGLMVGRTPELLGKKIESREMKYAMLAVLILPLAILGLTGISAMLPIAVASIGTPGPHGLSEILYAFTSATGNNGSAFGGLSANTPWYNTTLGIAMLLGRFAYAVPVLAIAGSLAAKPRTAATAGTFPTTTPLFVGLLIGIILIMGGLQFFPALALGPIVEHFAMSAGQTF
jgi:K+-transporting ATPase ATPase A chain